MAKETAREAARREVNEERFASDKEEYKVKLTQLADAKKIVANVEREIEDLDARIAESTTD